MRKALPNSTPSSNLQKASEIALSDLRQCYSSEGILAGTHQFSDYWARDGLFASWGALSAGDLDIVRKELELLLVFQAPDGQLPLRVGQYFLGLKMLGLSNTQEMRPRYDQDKYGSRPTDQNSLFIITFWEYLQKSKDVRFLKNNYASLKKAIDWNLAQDKDKDGLMEEGHYASWADSLKKRGKVLYTNVLYCQALKIMGTLAEKAGYPKDSRYYFALSTKVKAELNKHFWNGSYYSDWIGPGGKRMDFFSTDGNLLSILFSIADKKQAHSIQGCITQFGISSSVPSRTNHPKYPLHLQSQLDTLAGVGDYHNGLSWLWLGAIDAAAKLKMGKKAEAGAELEKIAKITIEHNGVYEVYTKEGKPVNRLLYKSEHPFAWSAGLFLYAIDMLKKSSK